MQILNQDIHVDLRVLSVWIPVMRFPLETRGQYAAHEIVTTGDFLGGLEVLKICFSVILLLKNRVIRLKLKTRNWDATHTVVATGDFLDGRDTLKIWFY